MPTDRSRDTKTTILDEAMYLFSENGFHATTVKEIAAAVGIKDASLYNHFAGKQAIFDAIIEQALDTMKHTYGNQGILVDVTDDASSYGGITFTALRTKVLDTFEYLLADAYMVRLRRLLAVNQYTNQQASEAYRFIFSEQPLRLQETVFGHLMETGEFKTGDIRLIALEFYGPVFLLMHAETPWAEAKNIIGKHFEAFYRSHSTAKELL